MVQPDDHGLRRRHLRVAEGTRYGQVDDQGDGGAGMNKLSYMLFGGTSMPTTGPLLSGLFSWVEAFQMFGKNGARFASMSKDTLENYDIVHVNFTPGAATYALAIRDRLGEHSSTKLVLNVDFAVGMWNTIDPYILKKVCEAADYLFHVEPMGATGFSGWSALKCRPCLIQWT